MACCCAQIIPGCIPREAFGNIPACDGLKNSITLEVFDPAPNPSAFCAQYATLPSNPHFISRTFSQTFSLALEGVVQNPFGCVATYGYTQPLLPAPDNCGPQRGRVQVDMNFSSGAFFWNVVVAYANVGFPGFCCNSGTFNTDCTINLPATQPPLNAWTGPAAGFGRQACSNLSPQTITTNNNWTWFDRQQTECLGNAKVRITA